MLIVDWGGILNKNAFTLIELLAIIVILAIIAVITVPIILNIIENSRKGAATDSAYGYKDAVNKAYVTELSKPNNGSLKLNGIYVVQSDGTLEPASGYTFGVTGYDSLPVSLSGEKPSSGTLTYENNVLTGATLIIGDYTATYSNGSFTTAKTSSSSNETSGQAAITWNKYYTPTQISGGSTLPDGAEFWGQENTTTGDREVCIIHSNDTLCFGTETLDFDVSDVEDNEEELIFEEGSTMAGIVADLKTKGFTCFLGDGYISCGSDDGALEFGGNVTTVFKNSDWCQVYAEATYNGYFDCADN